MRAAPDDTERVITEQKCGYCGEWVFDPCLDPDDSDECPHNPDPPEPE